MSWVTNKTVLFISQFNFKNKDIISVAPCGSRPAVGSSKTKTSGFKIKIPAIATRLFCPPLNSKGDLPKYDSSKPTKGKTLRTKAFASSSEVPKFFGPKAISFSMVSSNNWYSGNWKTRPTFFRNSLISFIFNNG